MNIRKLTRSIVSAPVEVAKGTVDAFNDAVEWWLPTYTREEYKEIKRKRDADD